MCYSIYLSRSYIAGSRIRRLVSNERNLLSVNNIGGNRELKGEIHMQFSTNSNIKKDFSSRLLVRGDYGLEGVAPFKE